MKAITDRQRMVIGNGNRDLSIKLLSIDFQETLQIINVRFSKINSGSRLLEHQPITEVKFEPEQQRKDTRSQFT